MQCHRIGRKLLLAALVLSSLLSAVPGSDCRAERVTVGVVAILSYIDDFYCQCIREGDFEIGDTLRAFYSYDTGAVDTEPSPYAGRYLYPDPANCFRVYHRNFTFASDPDSVSIVIAINDSLSSGGVNDAYRVYSWWNTPDTVYAGMIGLILMQLVDPTLTAISGDALPTEPPDLSMYSTANLMVAGSSYDWSVWGDIIAITSGPPTAVIASPSAPSVLNTSPNPFSGQASIRYTLHEAGDVTLKIFDVRGRCVRTLHEGRVPSRDGEIQWDGRDDHGKEVPSGVYFVRLRSGKVTATQKMLMLR